MAARAGCTTCRAAKAFDFDPIIHLPSPYPNYISDLRSSYEELAEVKVTLDIERQVEFTRISRTIETPAGRLSDRLIQHKPGIGYGFDPNPVWEERLVKSLADLEALRFLLPKPAPEDYRDILAIQEMVGENGLVNLYVNSPLDHQAGWAVDLQALMVACYDDPQFVSALLQLFFERTLAETRAALEAGVEVIFTPWYFASLSAGWSPGLYEKLFLPLVRQQVALVHQMGGLYHYYDDGAVMRILPWLAEAGIDILSSFPPPPMGDFDFALAKSQFGDRICFNGNLDLIHVIKNGTPESIHAAVRQLILTGAPGGGFILGTSDSIRDTGLANVRAFFEAARKYGDYSTLQEFSYAHG